MNEETAWLRHRERTGAGRETVLFFAVNGIGVAITEGCIGLTYPLGLGGRLSYNIALNVGIALATVFRYRSCKKWVWPAGTVTSGEAVPRAPAHPPSARFLGAMSIVRLSCGRLRLLIAQPVKFGVVAAFGFLITVAGTYLLYTRAGAGPLISAVIAALVAVAVSYAGNRYAVSRSFTGRPGPRTGLSAWLTGYLTFVITHTVAGRMVGNQGSIMAG
jgi:putative flippase GtrA